MNMWRHSLVLAIVAVLAGCGDSGYQDLEAPGAKSAAPAGAAPRHAAPGGGAPTPRDKATPPAGEWDRRPAAPVADEAVAISRATPRPAATFEGKPAPRRAESESPATSPSDSPQTPPPPSRPQPKPQSGQLTAGSIDDQRGFADYLAYLDRMASRRWLPQFAPASRIVVTVENDAGERVADARVVVQPEQGSPCELTTGSDGQAVFVGGFDLPLAESCTVTVTAPDATPVRARHSTKDGLWTIVVPNAPHALPARLDLALVIDATGSMTDELRYLQAEIDDIAAAVSEKYPRIVQRYALVVYRDQGDQFVTRQWDFTESLADFQKNLNAQRAAGGGDLPEAVDEALQQAASLSWSDKGAARVVFLVGDAPPHTRNAARAFDAVGKLRQRGASVFPVACSGVDDEAEHLFRASAFLTRGQYLFLTDHSGIGAPHAKPQTPRYEVERLDQLMIRMIAWKLSGLEYQPDQVIDVGGESVQSSPPIARPTVSTPPHAAPPVPRSVPPARPAPETAAAARGVALSWLPNVPRPVLSALVVVAVLGLAFGDYFVGGWRRRR